MTDNTKITTPPSSLQYLLAKIGLFILFVSLALGLLFSCRLFSGKIMGVFSQPLLDFVNFESFTGLDCPTLLNRNETGVIYTTIANEAREEKAFSISLAAGTQAGSTDEAQFESVPFILSGAEVKAWWSLDDKAYRVSGTLAAGEVRRDSWQVRLPEGATVGNVAVLAYVDNGNRLYWGSCGLAFTQVPGITGGQMKLFVLSGVPVGVLLWLYGRRRLGRLAFGGLVVTMILWILMTLALV